MRSSGSFLFALAIGSTTTIPQVRASPEVSLNLTAAAELPACVTACGLSVLPSLNCTIGAPCYCAQTGPVAQGLASCVNNGCEKISDALKGLKFQADSCGWRTDRNSGPHNGHISIALFTVTTFFLVARLASRWRWLGGAGFWWDDGVAVMCYFPILAMFIVGQFSIRYGFGRDLWMVSIPDFKMWSKMFFVLQPLYVFNAYFAKFSLLLLYLRIWPAADSRNHKFRLLCKAIGVFTFLAGISTLLAVIFACHPITVAMRKPNRAGGACIDRIGLNYTVGGINIILDILVIAMPIPRLLKLKISTIQKLGVICCFLVGFAVTGCSIYRLTHLHQLTTIRNATWDFIQLAQWSIIEVTCQMISICMPAMAGCLRRTFTFVRAKSSLASSRDRINSFEMITEKTSKGSDYSEGESRDVVSPAPMMYSADEQGRIVKSTLRPYLSAV